MERPRWNKDIESWLFFFIAISIFFCGCGRKNIETTVSGSVFSANNQPIAYATVFTEKSCVMADAEGSFKLKEYGRPSMVRAQAAGYEIRSLKYRGKPLTFKLKPRKPGNADVIVRDSKGAPIRNTSVVIFDSNSLAPIGLIQASENGLVRLKNIPAGTLLLGIINKGFEPRLRSFNIRSGKTEKINTDLSPYGVKPAQTQAQTTPDAGGGGIKTVIQLPNDPDALQPGQNRSISYRSTNEWDFGGGTLGPDTVTTLGGIRSSAHTEGIFKIDTMTGNQSIGLGFDLTPFQDQSAQIPGSPKTPDSAPPYQGTAPQSAITKAPPSFSSFIVRKEFNAASDNIDVTVSLIGNDKVLKPESVPQWIPPTPLTQGSDPRTPAPANQQDEYPTSPSLPSLLTPAEREALKKEIQARRQLSEEMFRKKEQYSKEMSQIYKEIRRVRKIAFEETRGHYATKQRAAYKAAELLSKKYSELMNRYSIADELWKELKFYGYLESMLTGLYFTDLAKEMRKYDGIPSESAAEILERSSKIRSRAEAFLSSE